MKLMLHALLKQLTLFFYALSYFTRVPIPPSVIFDDKQFHKASAYLPIIGMLVASVMIATFFFCQLFFSLPVSIALMLIVSLLLTGALHEDGFADCCDGFGGGYHVTQRLKIMKDSQIGSYGGLGLIVLFLLKFSLLIELAELGIAVLTISLLLAHTLSRYGALCIMQTLSYVRLDNAGKVQGLATKLNAPYFIFSSLCALGLLFFVSINSALLIFISAIIVGLFLRTLFRKKVGGYTGDCLGFTQQSIEVIVLLLLTASLPV